MAVHEMSVGGIEVGEMMIRAMDAIPVTDNGFAARALAARMSEA
jgi:hypothetical protein